VLILPEKNNIFLSRIFNWYKKDFGGKKQMFLKENMDKIGVEYLFYDWNLNH